MIKISFFDGFITFSLKIRTLMSRQRTNVCVVAYETSVQNLLGHWLDAVVQINNVISIQFDKQSNNSGGQQHRGGDGGCNAVSDFD